MDVGDDQRALGAQTLESEDTPRDNVDFVETREMQGKPVVNEDEDSSSSLRRTESTENLKAGMPPTEF